MAFGVIYAILPDLTKKHLKNLGEIHFWLTIFGGFSLALLFSVIGTEDAIRREADMPAAYHWAMPWLLFFALTIGMSQIIFVYNLIKTLRRKPTKKESQDYERLHQNPEGIGYDKGRIDRISDALGDILYDIFPNRSFKTDCKVHYNQSYLMDSGSP
jgi:heme/copper-type cytochrome/quinol oxidase subunit 1